MGDRVWVQQALQKIAADFTRSADTPLLKVGWPARPAQIACYGGECALVDEPSQICAVAQRLAEDLRGHFMDQFTYAERATDWRGQHNIAQAIYAQLHDEPAPIPQWIVVGTGTGGTAATIGRYLRYQRYETRLCVVDPEGAACVSGSHSRCTGSAHFATMAMRSISSRSKAGA